MAIDSSPYLFLSPLHTTALFPSCFSPPTLFLFAPLQIFQVEPCISKICICCSGLLKIGSCCSYFLALLSTHPNQLRQIATQRNKQEGYEIYERDYIIDKRRKYKLACNIWFNSSSMSGISFDYVEAWKDYSSLVSLVFVLVITPASSYCVPNCMFHKKA